MIKISFDKIESNRIESNRMFHHISKKRYKSKISPKNWWICTEKLLMLIVFYKLFMQSSYSFHFAIQKLLYSVYIEIENGSSSLTDFSSKMFAMSESSILVLNVNSQMYKQYRGRLLLLLRRCDTVHFRDR